MNSRPSSFYLSNLSEGSPGLDTNPAQPQNSEATAQPRSNFTNEDWQASFDERAGIREFDGEMRRDEAEALALQDTIAALGSRPRTNPANLL
jgi:hypothetical protein